MLECAPAAAGAQGQPGELVKTPPRHQLSAVMMDKADTSESERGLSFEGDWGAGLPVGKAKPSSVCPPKKTYVEQ